MYTGKYKHKNRRLRWNRSFVLMLSVIVLLVGAVGGSLAYLFTNTEPVVNTFTPGEVPPTIIEEFDGVTKSNVTVTNKGNVDAYVRAAIVVTWQDANGNVYSKMPVLDTDYTMSINTDDWTPNGGYYYYTSVVAANGTTSALINTATPKNTEPEGYTLHIEIMAQTIQADGMNATSAVEAFANAQTAQNN